MDLLCLTCGVPETAEHMVTAWTALSNLKASLARVTEINVPIEEELFQLVSVENFLWFMKFINNWKVVIGLTYFNLDPARRGPARGRR